MRALAEEARPCGCERLTEQSLQARWRLIERVVLERHEEGNGFSATIYLNRTLVRAAAEQQGLLCSPAAAEAAWARRLEVISDCVDGLNATLAETEAIRGFVVLG